MCIVMWIAVQLSHSLPLHSISKRSFNCSGKDLNSKKLQDQLQWSDMNHESLVLPINVTYDQLEDTLYVLNHVNTNGETPFTTCRSITDEIFRTPTSRYALCSWKYTCDYSSTRFPAYIFHAKCSTDTFQYRYFHAMRTCQCRPITVALKVLKFNGCDPVDGREMWSMEEQAVDVGCTCITTQER